MSEPLRRWTSTRRRSDVFEVHEAIAQLSVYDEPQVDIKTHPPQLDLVSITFHC